MKVDGSGARAVTAPGGVTVAFGAAAQASAWPIWLLISLIVAFAAMALLDTALMATAGRHVELTLVRLIGGTRQHAWRIIAWEALITSWACCRRRHRTHRRADPTRTAPLAHRHSSDAARRNPGRRRPARPIRCPGPAGLVLHAGLWPGPAVASKALHVLRRSA
jgi:hypothetical protein